MITVEIVGGPRDGQRLAVESPHSLVTVEVQDPATLVGRRQIILKPQLTANGWRMYWPPTQ